MKLLIVFGVVLAVWLATADGKPSKACLECTDEPEDKLCAVDIQNRKRTFNNACEMTRANCKQSKKGFTFLSAGACPPKSVNSESLRRVVRDVATTEIVAAQAVEFPTTTTTTAPSSVVATGSLSYREVRENESVAQKEAEQTRAQVKEQMKVVREQGKEKITQTKEQVKLAKQQGQEKVAQAKEQVKVAKPQGKEQLAQAKEQVKLAEEQNKQKVALAKENANSVKKQEKEKIAQAKEQAKLARQKANEKLAQAKKQVRVAEKQEKSTTKED